MNSFLNFYCQFIDDIFFLWNGTVIQLQEFIKKLNNHHPKIKFDFKFSKISTEFLETTVHKNKEQKNKINYWQVLIVNQPIRKMFYIKLLLILDAWKKYTKTSESSKNLKVLKKSFIIRGFNEKKWYIQGITSTEVESKRSI